MNRLRSSLLILALASIAACGGGDDSTSPTEAVAGTYHATSITVTFTGGPPLDIIALGGSIDIVLTPQGTTTGTLVVPALLTEDGVDEDVIDLAGTFTVNGNSLTFQGQGGSDTLFHQQVWTIGNGILTAVNTQPEGTLEMTLTRS